MATCTQCGTRAPAGTKFCSNCGGQMQQPAPAASAAVHCTNCGSEVPAGHKFCGNCGSQVASVQA